NALSGEAALAVIAEVIILHFLLCGDPYSLDHYKNVTEYNTALNRRIPQLPISVEEARRKKRPRGNVAFIEQEEIINPEDVDPSIGRFRNLVATAIISNNPAKRTAPEVKGHEPPRK
ncbi:hypothetical protein TELCIR_21294, partial [Teladorsagia circumcincta]